MLKTGPIFPVLYTIPEIQAAIDNFLVQRKNSQNDSKAAPFRETLHRTLTKLASRTMPIGKVNNLLIVGLWHIHNSY